jgi:hypothetical protein
MAFLAEQQRPGTVRRIGRLLRCRLGEGTQALRERGEQRCDQLGLGGAEGGTPLGPEEADVALGAASDAQHSPQLLVGEHHWSVLSVGVWLLPGAVIGAVLSRLAGKPTAGDNGHRLLAAVSLALPR